MKKRFANLLAVLSLVLPVGVSVSASPAHAAARCGLFYLCAYPGTNFTGTPVAYSQNLITKSCYTGFVASKSIDNLAGYKVRLFSGYSCTGSYKDVPNTQRVNLGFTAGSIIRLS